MEPTDFASFASDLLHDLPSDDSSQVILRTVINRAYLGALMVTAARLERIKGRGYPRDKEFYGAVESDLQYQLPGFKDKLGTLRRYRADADYDLETFIPRTKSEHALRVALSYIDELGEKLG